MLGMRHRCYGRDAMGTPMLVAMPEDGGVMDQLAITMLAMACVLAIEDEDREASGGGDA